MNTLRRLFFPPRCSACNTLLDWLAPHQRITRGSVHRVLCSECAEKWMEAERATCDVCASPVKECLCLPQMLKSARVQALFKLTYYLPRTRTETPNRVVYHVKEQGDKETARFLAERLAPGIAEGLRTEGIAWESCVLTYLPRTARAVRTHGTDQSKNLARALSEVLEIPMYRLIRRKRGSQKTQKTLTLAEREKNALRSFRAVRSTRCNGKTILLVDDVVTTGAGMAACARLLYRLGARRVLGVCIAVDDINREMGVMGRIRRDSWDEKHFFTEK